MSKNSSISEVGNSNGRVMDGLALGSVNNLALFWNFLRLLIPILGETVFSPLDRLSISALDRAFTVASSEIITSRFARPSSNIRLRSSSFLSCLLHVDRQWHSLQSEASAGRVLSVWEIMALT